MIFSKLKIATQSSRKWRLNTTPATWKLYSKLKACPANFHACHACHACHAWPISQRFASHELTQNQYIKNTIKSRIPFANLQTYCTVDTKGCIQTGSNFGTQKTRHFWRPIRVPPRYSRSLPLALPGSCFIASPCIVRSIDTGEQARSVNLLETWGLVSRRGQRGNPLATGQYSSLGTLKVLRMGTTFFLLSNPQKLAPLIVTLASTNTPATFIPNQREREREKKDVCNIFVYIWVYI